MIRINRRGDLEVDLVGLGVILEDATLNQGWALLSDCGILRILASKELAGRASSPLVLSGCGFNSFVNRVQFCFNDR